MVNLVLPSFLAFLIHLQAPITPQHYLLLHCFSLLLLGMFLATLATLNFSLSLFVGLLSAPLSFIGNPSAVSIYSKDVFPSPTSKICSTIGLQVVSPPIVLWAACYLWGAEVGQVLAEAAFGWKVNGLWTQVVVWCVWWPAWLAGSVLVSPFL